MTTGRLLPWSTDGRGALELQKTRKSSAPRPFIGYISGQWHTRQPQSPEQLAAINWYRSHDYRTTERAVRRLRSTEAKTPQKTRDLDDEGTQTGANGPGSSYRVDTELWESLCSSLRRPVTSKSVPAALVAVHGCGPRRAKPPKKRQNRVLRGRI